MSDADPAVRIASRLATELLAPDATTVDRCGIPPSHIEAIKASGLLGMAVPVEYGGLGTSGRAQRRVGEILAGADCSTYFVQAQHHPPTAMLARADQPARTLLPQLADGTLMGGVAFSHLRAYPRRPVTATAVPGGWRLDGHAPWLSGWGLNDVVMIGGITADDECIFGYVPAREQPGLTASTPLELAALQATATVAITLEGLHIPEDMVAVRLPFAVWSALDRRTTVNVNPAVFGLIAAVTDRLLEAEDRGSAAAGAALAEQAQAAQERCYRLIDDVDPAEAIGERLGAKTAATELMLRASATLVAAGGGRAMGTGNSAQRLAREALFLVVQAQTTEVRIDLVATLAGLPR